MENFFGHVSLSLSLKFQPPPPMIMIMMLMQIDLFHYGRHDNIIINSFIFLKMSILGLMLWTKNFVVFKHVTSNRRLERRDHIWFYMIYERICEAHNLELRFVWHAVFDKKFVSRFIFPETQQSLPVPSTKVVTPSRRRVSSSDSDTIPDSPPKGKIYSNIICMGSWWKLCHKRIFFQELWNLFWVLHDTVKTIFYIPGFLFIFRPCRSSGKQCRSWW